MSTRKIPTTQGVVACGIGMLVFVGAALLSGVGTSPAFGAADKAAGATNQTTSIKGTCNFGGTESTWSATLTAKAGGTYDAVYVSTWGGN